MAAALYKTVCGLYFHVTGQPSVCSGGCGCLCTATNDFFQGFLQQLALIHQFFHFRRPLNAEVFFVFHNSCLWVIE